MNWKNNHQLQLKKIKIYFWLVEAFKNYTGYYPESVHVDQIYRPRENRKFCKERGRANQWSPFFQQVLSIQADMILLPGESLGLDLGRMEKAYIESDRRGFEIFKNISLLELDPVALL